MRKRNGALWLAVLAILAERVSAEGFVPPTGAGYVNVKTNGGAKGDGVSDDTAALKAIIEAGKSAQHPKFGAAREIYLPDGIYLVTEPIRIGDKKKSLIGQSRNGTVIRLKDNSPTFQDPKRPTPVLSFAKSYKGWHFAQNFFQRVHDLTIDVGSGNPGAVGLEYHTNNGGDAFNLLIKSSDPQKRGAVGLSQTAGSGPGLIHHVTVDGFEVGSLITGSLHSMAFSQIALTNQRVVGFENRGNTVSIEGLVSRNRVPALKTSGGHLALANAEMTGGAPDQSAIVHDKTAIFLRHVKTQGYGTAIAGEGQKVAGPDVDQLVWPKVWSLFPGPGNSLDLPIERPPFDKLGEPKGWFVVAADASGDLTAPLQQAIDAGREHIFVSAAKFGAIRDTIHVRNKVRIIRGAATYYHSKSFNDQDKLISYQPLKIEKAAKKKPVWRIEDGEGEAVMLQLLADSYGDAGWGVEHATRRTLILWAAGGSYRNTVTGGKVFFVDAGPFPGSEIVGPQQAWAWHANTESYVDDPHILNNGATLWILGLKTEKDRTIIKTTRGGRTELIGGLLYKNRERIGPAPAFISEDSSVSLSYAVTGLPYQVQVRETRDGRTRELPQSEVGRTMPLYVGLEAATPK